MTQATLENSRNIQTLILIERAWLQTSSEDKWAFLTAAHIVGQLDLALHLQCHLAMLRLSWLEKRWTEMFGQLLRLILAPLGHIFGKLPIGNTGRSNVSAFKAMPVSADIQSIIDSAKSENLVLPIHGLHCSSCVRKVEQALKPFADAVKVTLEPMQVQLIGLKSHASFEAMANAVAEIGDYRLESNQQSIQKLTPVTDAKKQITVKDRWMNWLKSYKPLLLIVVFILGASVLVQLGQHAEHSMGFAAVSGSETMRYFMAGFFLVFAFFKLLDLRAFADAYAGYDLLSARWHGWGYVYPFVELALGMAYLSNFKPFFTAWVTLAVMGFSSVGVILAVMRKSSIRCACLGTVFQLPMSTVTIVEDIGMVAMAVLMLMWM